MQKRKILILLFILFFTACSSEQTSELHKEQWVYGILSETPQPFPCWEGICPGDTTWEEAYSILKENDQVFDISRDLDSDFERDDRVYFNFRTVYQEPAPNDIGILLVDPDTKLIHTLKFSFRTTRLTLGEFINIYGFPEEFYNEWSVTTKGEIEPQLNYPQYNMLLGIIAQTGIEDNTVYVEIEENDYIRAIVLLAENEYNEIEDFTEEMTFPVVGYGKNYQDK